MYHVFPINDVKKHDTESTTCWCNPRVEWRDPKTGKWYDTGIVIHNSSDHREIIEEAERILKQEDA